MMNTHLRPLALAVLLSGARLLADTPAPADPAARLAEARKLADSLHYEKGTIALHGDLAKLSLPESYRYLNPADTATLLTKIWHNPNGSGTLGMIVPAGFDPLTGESWAVVVTFDEDGYVKDDDAAKIKYDELLQQMKEGTAEASKEREKAGYAPIELVGWAAPPRYDASSHKLYWAKEIKFGNEPEHTLNYNIRMLGRRGVLVLNAVATMPQLKEVEAATPTLLAMVDFQQGHRYVDFDSSNDKVATYGLAALVAGGIAAKAGFFKLLWVGILAFKKLIILAAIAIAGYARKLMAKIRGQPDNASGLRAPTDTPTSPPSTTA
jgi:uncharacterized membrane-anchored protein